MILDKGFFKDAGILTKILHLILIFLICTVIALLTWQLFSDGDTENINSIKLLQLIQSIWIFVIPPFILSYMWSEQPLSYLKLKSEIKLTELAIVVLIMVAAIPAINLLSQLNQQLILPEYLQFVENWMRSTEEATAILTQKLVNVKGIAGLLFNIFVIAIVPALGEELFFRGTIQKIFSEWKNSIFAIWITAFIFSSIHFQFYGFLPRLLLGAFFGYLLVWSGNLWLPIIGHFTNNVMAVIFYYLRYNGYNVMDIDETGTGKTLWIGILSCFLTITGIVLLKKKYKNKHKSSTNN